MINKHVLTPVREKLLKNASIPVDWSFEVDSTVNCLNFEIHFVDNDFDYADRLWNACRYFNKSSISDRFKYEVVKNHTNWGYCIHASIKVNTRKGESIEDLVTVLRLEGLI